MAKRVKMEKLADSPEVEKLINLNSELSKVLQKESAEEKIRKYEELLAEYRQLMDKFTREKSRSADVDINDVKAELSALLQEKGVHLGKDKVLFPLNLHDRKRLRHPRKIYSRMNYDKTMQYLTSKDQASTSKISVNIMKSMFPFIKNKIKIEDYPNYRQFYDEHVVRFNGKWNKS